MYSSSRSLPSFSVNVLILVDCAVLEGGGVTADDDDVDGCFPRIIVLDDDDRVVTSTPADADAVVVVVVVLNM